MVITSLNDTFCLHDKTLTNYAVLHFNQHEILFKFYIQDFKLSNLTFSHTFTTTVSK